MLDRVNESFGFGESKRIIRSLATYLQLAKPRKDYRKLKGQLESLGYEIPSSQRYKDLAYLFSEGPVKEAIKDKLYMDFALGLYKRS